MTVSRLPALRGGLAALAALTLVACGGGEETTPASSAATAVPGDDGEAAETRTVPAPEGSLAGGEMALGSESAPVTLIEYASLTCPACANFHENIVPVLKEEYVDTGKVRYVFREFPTSPAALSYAASYLARCAATERGSPAYFAVIDTLYDRQREWAYGEEPGKVLEDIASQAGIGRSELETCFYREDVKTAVKDNVATAVERYNVNSTPTLIVGEEKLDWGGSPEGFRAALDRAIANNRG